MTNHTLLDNVTHKHPRIISNRSEAYGDKMLSVVTYPFEFADVQTHSPICFCKDPEMGEFYSAALFGFEGDENLFLAEDGWDASYIPLTVQRQPFLIGFGQMRCDSCKTITRHSAC